ncbi:hypothetical protein [Parasphingorhabdus sp.]|uniref:hypothetical protein n=1 Tax=Parasphingorhabdus sp. TaxID=2709688 RepID=UPI003D2C289A
MSFSHKATRRILSSTAAAAIICASSGAYAQNSYDAGDPTVVSGTVTFDRLGTPNTEIYTIDSNTAVLDFIPNDIGPGGPINFQLAGTVAQYLGGLGITDFTVLNRIFAADPSRAIQFDGTVISRLQSSPTTPGGSVWFYSPGGIIVGSTAVFDVGNLLLAAGDPTGGSGVITDPNQFTINSVADSNAAITVQAGAQITASNPGSYVALVAPAIIQSGTVSTNGSAAYVAAEQTTLTFNSGLFNITTTVGSNANGNAPLVHDGTTRFIDDAGQRRAYLVSVAKNDAITMLIEGSGQLGFDTATGVNIDNGVVVLSGGYDVTDTVYTDLAGTAGTFRHDIQITNPTNNADFFGQVNPFAPSEIRINSLGQAQSFAGDVSMNAGSLASITNTAGGSVDIFGNLDLSTLVYGARETNFIGGNILLDASLGDISIGGNTSLTSFTDADFLGGLDPAGTVQGGTIAVISDNGNAISMLGDLDVLVEANGADQLLISQTSAGNAVGGNVVFASSGAATISVGGIANIANTATGGTVQISDATAGNATGGLVNILAVDGDIAFGSDLTVSATGTGGQVNASGTTSAGDGTGGQVSITIGTGDFSVTGSLNANVSGSGGSTQFATDRSGGDGAGGSVNINVLQAAGSLSVVGGSTFTANGNATDGVANGAGGDATGGSILISTFGGIIDLSSALIGARASGGSAANGSVGSATGGNITVAAQGGLIQSTSGFSLNAVSLTGIGTTSTGVASQGGTISVQADGGNINLGGLNADAAGSGQFLTGNNDGADAIGGTVQISASNAGTITVGASGIVAIANALGGDSNVGDGQAGDAQAGMVSITATTDGTIGADSLQIFSLARAGSGLSGGFSGGNGTGGQAIISQDTGGRISAGSLLVSADGIGGTTFGGSGIGGTGQGGSVQMTANDNLIQVNGSATLSANGLGGAAIGGVKAGSGLGGIVNINVDGGMVDISGSADLRAEGLSTNINGATTTGDGGDTTGGNVVVSVSATGGTINIGGLAQLTAHARSSSGAGAGSVGGLATGGTAQILAQGGNITLGDAVLSANAFFGSGLVNSGLIQQAGLSSVNADGGDITVNGSLNLDARSARDFTPLTVFGGVDATGGTSTISAMNGSTITISGPVTQSASGLGGDANIGAAGIGRGGSATLRAVGGGIIDTTGQYSMDAGGSGGNAVNASGLSGSGFGGTVDISASGGTLNFGGGFSAASSGRSGNTLSAVNADSGAGTGGTITMTTDTNGLIDIAGLAVLNADATGQSGIGSGNGGNGVGGSVQVLSQSGTMNFANLLFLRAIGTAGAGADNSGVFARGGTLDFQADGGNIGVTGQLALTADAFATAPNVGQDGADGFGGSSIVSAINGGNIAIDGAAIITAAGNGSDAHGGVTGLAGNGLGGNSQIVATGNGLIAITGGATVNSQAIGGNGLVAGTDGGDGTGGTASISQGTGGFVQIDGSADVFADGTGGINRGGGDGIGGTGQGGDARLVSNDGNVIVGQARVGAGGIGGATDGGIAGGNGIGGLANIGADTGLTRVIGDTFITSSGIGGGALTAGANGGNGIGGQALVGSIGAGAIELLGASVNLNASATGGNSVGGTGGSGTGGTVQIFASAGRVDSVGFNLLDAAGNGGAGQNGGVGTGGFASMFTATNGAINAGSGNFSARGRGGAGSDAGNSGGFGQGGTMELLANGTIAFSANFLGVTSGNGGSGANDADGGDGSSGNGRFIADGGTIRFDSSTRISGSTSGGNIISGTGSGGDAQGGLSQMIARNGGSLQMLGLGSNVSSMGTSAFGGNGLFGSASAGNAIGGTSTLLAESGGTVNIAGGFLATASGFGGNDFFDPSSQYADLGGNGSGGAVNIIANGGNIIGTSDVAILTNGSGGLGVVDGGDGVGGLINVQAADGLIDFSTGTDGMLLSVTGTGGNAVTQTDGAGNILRGGGNGGDGVGGNLFLLAGNAGPSNGQTGILRVGDIRVSENAATPQGLSAIGGTGADGAAGQDGGDGGDAAAGIIFIGSNNENGVFEARNVNMGSIAQAGAGGFGGLADGGGIFGNGGDGGDAFARSMGLGAFTDIGASTTGSAQFGDVIMNIAAIGGKGGDAQGGNAIGGIGGDAREGVPGNFGSLAAAFIIARAMPVTLGNATLTASATGGDGGLDAAGARSAGGIAEGFATSFSAAFGATDNLGRGSLTGNDYIGRAISMGGLGAGDIRANSFMGASGLTVVVGDVQLNSAILEAGGIQQRTDIDPNEFAPYAFVAGIDGIVTIAGDLTIISDNEFNLLPIGTGEINIGNDLFVTAGLGNNTNVSPFGPAVDELNVDGNIFLTLGGDFIFTGDIDVAGDFNVTTGGLIQTANITSASGITLLSGSTISTGNLSASGDISLTGMADEILGLPASIATGNIISLNGSINVVTNIGDITLGNLNSMGAITVDAGHGSTSANAGGDIVIGTIQGSDLGILGTDNLTLGDTTVTNALTLNFVGAINAANMTSGTDINLTSGSSIQTLGLNAGGQLNLNAVDQITVAGDISTGDVLNISTLGPISTQDINAGGFVRILSGDSQYMNGSTVTTGAIMTTDGLNIRATGDISVGSINGQLGLNLFGRSNITTGDIMVGNTANIGTEGDLNLGSVASTNGPVTINAAGMLTAGALSSGDTMQINGQLGVNLQDSVTAVQSVSVITGGTASFDGLVDAPNISVTSADIAIGTLGGLGGSDTNDLEINAAAPSQPIIFGGDGSGGGYNLNATEATKLRSRTIRFNAIDPNGAGTAGITIDDFTLEGSLAGTSANLIASQLDFNAPGTIRVIGAGLLNNAGTNDRIALFAGQRIEVVTDLGGSLRMRNAMGDPGGNLLLSATNIAVGTDSLLSQLAANPRFTGRDDIVNAPDGSNTEAGFIEANFLDLVGGDTIVIQNSNSAALRGGFTTGTAGVLIGNFGGSSTASPLDVVINGRIADGAGGFLTNEATLQGVMIEPGNTLADFSTESSINSCLLSGGTCTAFDVTPDTPDTPDQPEEGEEPDTIASDVREIIHDYEPDDTDDADEEQEDDERAAELPRQAAGKRSPIAPRVPVVSTNSLNRSPVITDPITGSGNPNFIDSELAPSSPLSSGTTNEGGQ